MQGAVQILRQSIGQSGMGGTFMGKPASMAGEARVDIIHQKPNGIGAISQHRLGFIQQNGVIALVLALV